MGNRKIVWYRLKNAMLIGLVVLLTAENLAASLSTLRADDDSPGMARPVSWQDETPTARYRNRGDWLVDVGIAEPADVYGPFKGRAYHKGNTERFFALDFDSKAAPHYIVATLRLITDHAYWWFEQGSSISQDAIAEAGKIFETQIYPLNHKLFGQEWSPGIDGDQHLFILFQAKIGGDVAGVFNRTDECPRSLCPDSNQHELIYVGLDNGPPNSPQQLAVITHEFQHLIAYNMGNGEEHWLNEGLSQLAEHLNGFDPRAIASSNLREFLQDPNVQLNSWPVRRTESPKINYAASYIFCVYLYQRFGTRFIQRLSQSTYSGLAAVVDALRTLAPGLTLDEVFVDWTVTNYVNNREVNNGRYYYQSLRLPQRASSIPLRPNTRWQNAVYEYGSDYLELAGSTTYTLNFDGDSTVNLTDAPPTGAKWIWWSLNSEQGVARLERDFDLTHAFQPALTYRAYWNLPTELSWGNVLISTDGGKHWRALKATGMSSCRFTDSDACYTGRSRNWKQETIDLSGYAGQRIRIRFEYVADGAPPTEGLFLDDIAIPAIGYADSIEKDMGQDSGGWARQGFMPITTVLPQQWAVNVILRTSPPTVIPMKLKADNTGQITFSAPENGAIVVVAPMAPFVRATPNYVVHSLPK